MEFNTYEDLIEQESTVYEKTILEPPEIGWLRARKTNVSTIPTALYITILFQL
jgi:hypothetical protein